MTVLRVPPARKVMMVLQVQLDLKVKQGQQAPLGRKVFKA